MIQAFVPHAAQKAFADSICPARVRYGVRRTLMPLVVATLAKFFPNFFSLSRINYFGACPYAVASRRGTRDPRISRGSCHIHMDDLPRLLFNDKESKDRTEEEIRHLQKITGPYLCRMVA